MNSISITFKSTSRLQLYGGEASWPRRLGGCCDLFGLDRVWTEDQAVTFGDLVAEGVDGVAGEQYVFRLLGHQHFFICVHSVAGNVSVAALAVDEYAATTAN